MPACITDVYGNIMDDQDRLKALGDVSRERDRQNELVFDGIPSPELDKVNTRSNWSSYILDYLGRSTSGYRNKDQDFRQNMVKIAALAVAAIEAFDKGYACRDT